MNKPASIHPKNVSAQLAYHGLGNPPSTHPSTAISNCFPGLEMDFRNIWRHILVGIVLHESSNLVVSVDENAPPKVKKLRGWSLVRVHGRPLQIDFTGPVQDPSDPARSTGNGTLGTLDLEWSNALAEIVPLGGRRVTCDFQRANAGRHVRIRLKVRHFFDVDLDPKGEVIARRAVISKDLAGPGDLTQSLCSPWQNDYLECACFYWAASRPDYVNVEPGPTGKSIGSNWLDKKRHKKNRKDYIPDNSRSKDLISYNDLFSDWEKYLRFIIGGKDEEAPPKNQQKTRKKNKP
jgi:hypothetical protein